MTIRRNGALGERIGAGPFAVLLAQYAEGVASADAVADAFVRARIASHSATFDVDHADRMRLLSLVTECSDDPVFDLSEPPSVADALLRAREEDLRTLRQAGEQVSASVRDVIEQTQSISRAMSAEVARVLSIQQQAFAAVADVLAPTNYISEAARSAISSAALAARLIQPIRADLLASIPKFEFPRIPAELVMPPVLPDYSTLFSGVLAVDTSAYAGLAATLAATPRVPAALTALFDQESFRVSEIFAAARAASAFVAEQGAFEEAAVISEVASEAEEATRRPTLEDVLASLTRLHERLEEQEERRGRDRRDDRSFQIVLFILSLFISYYIALHFYLLGLQPIGR